jgi:hypothetical protein
MVPYRGCSVEDGTTPREIKVEAGTENGFYHLVAFPNEYAFFVTHIQILMNLSTRDFKAARRFVPPPRLVLVACAGPEEVFCRLFFLTPHSPSMKTLP